MIVKDEHGNKIVRAGAQVTKVFDPPASAGAA
jgi:stearoyl-CoA desaturase (delta-9 desaturase)